MSKQLLSSAVDAAASESEWDALMISMEQDPAIKAEWSRIWEWRDVRDGVKLSASSDFCGGVMAAIGNNSAQESRVVDLAAHRAGLAAVVPAPRRIWRTLVPLSAAAGVVAAVLVVGGLRGVGDGVTPATVAAKQAPEAVGTVALSAAESAALPDDAKVAILNAYLIEHSNSLADRSMGGTLANARFAARTADYRPDAP